MTLADRVLTLFESIPDKKLAAETVVTFIQMATKAELLAAEQAAVERGKAVKLERARVLAAERQKRFRNAQSRLSRVTNVTERDAVSPLDPLSDPDSSSSLSLFSDPERARSISETVVLSFVVCGKGKTWEATESLLKSHQEAFPGLDVMAQYRLAAAWLVSNSSRRKTPKGMPTFLFNWLSRAQNSGRPATGTPARNFREEATEQAFSGFAAQMERLGRP